MGSFAWASSVENNSLTSQTRIVINIPARSLSLYDHGELIQKFPIAVGSSTYKTPMGRRELNQIVWNPWWIPPDSAWAKDEKKTPPGPKNPLGPVKMELGDSIRIHGTNKEKSVGTAASHGCMRMFNEDAKKLAWWIQTHFSDKTNPALQEKYKAHPGQSFYVILNQTIPVNIVYEPFEIDGGSLVIHPDVYGRVEKVREKALQWLAKQGIDSKVLNEEVFEAFVLGVNTRQSFVVRLKDLVPGEWRNVETRIASKSNTGQQGPL